MDYNTLRSIYRTTVERIRLINDVREIEVKFVPYGYFMPNQNKLAIKNKNGSILHDTEAEARESIKRIKKLFKS